MQLVIATRAMRASRGILQLAGSPLFGWSLDLCGIAFLSRVSDPVHMISRETYAPSSCPAAAARCCAIVTAAAAAVAVPLPVLLAASCCEVRHAV